MSTPSTNYLEVYKKDGVSALLEGLAEVGFCPNLLNDDAGRWALVFDGYQSLVTGKRAKDVSTSFFVPKECWKNSVDAAIKYALKKL